MLVILFCLLFSQIIAIEQTKSECIMNTLLSYSRKNVLGDLSKIEQSNDPILFLLVKKPSHSMHKIASEILLNFELLPDDLKIELEICDSQQDEIKYKCESIYGTGNCELKNHFSFGPKCPSGYFHPERNTHNCERKCKATQIIIDADCQRHKTRILNKIKRYNSLPDCEAEQPFCKIVEGTHLFVGSCGMHEDLLEFVCVPLCVNEMTPERIDQIRKSKRYCWKDIIYLGSHIIDL